MPGNDLLSQGLSPQVPSALEGLTAVFGMGPGVSPPLSSPDTNYSITSVSILQEEFFVVGCGCPLKTGPRMWGDVSGLSPRPIRTRRLNALPRLHLGPIDLVISEGSYPAGPVGNLILRGASRLDAFSAYPGRTWLPSGAPGGTTGTPAVRPPRSSRTRGSSSQISCARDR